MLDFVIPHKMVVRKECIFSLFKCMELHIVKDVMVVFREAFHPSIRLVIHPWMASYRERNIAKKKTPSAHVSLSRKDMPGPRGRPPSRF
jgi:hypothetical protein